MKTTNAQVIENEIINVNVLELVQILSNIEKPTFCNIVTETVPKMRKTNNPFFGRIVKLNETRILIGTNYENRVNNNLSKENKETDFVVSKNNVGEHFSKCVLFNENTQKFYLQYERFDEIKPKTTYLCDGQPIEKSQFDMFLQISNYSNQGLDREVKILSVTVNNIKEMSLNGKKYKVIQ